MYAMLFGMLRRYGRAQHGAARFRAVHWDLRLTFVYLAGVSNLAFTVADIGRGGTYGPMELLWDVESALLIVGTYAMACGDPPAKEERELRPALAAGGPHG